MSRKTAFLGLAAIVVVSAAAAAWLIFQRLPASAQFRPAAAGAAPGAEKMSPADIDAAIKRSEEEIARAPDDPKTEKSYLSLAGLLGQRGDLARSKESYQKFIDKFPASDSILKAQAAIGDLNVRMLFSPEMTPGSVRYEVQKGDTLTRIAKKFGTTVELLSASNAIKGGVIRLGRKLKVSKARFSIVVDKAQNILTLKADGEIFKTYRVSTGKNESPTPAGTFKIVNKIVDPPWYPPSGKMIPPGDPGNVLGTRWLGISKPSYGIHGTIDPASIGKGVTEGCVRMKNEDVEELYAIVPEGTEVVIID
jgi:lipoprotein-anchoring transpeptidase ErfK/SrfK